MIPQQVINRPVVIKHLDAASLQTERLSCLAGDTLAPLTPAQKSQADAVTALPYFSLEGRHFTWVQIPQGSRGSGGPTEFHSRTIILELRYLREPYPFIYSISHYLHSDHF